MGEYNVNVTAMPVQIQSLIEDLNKKKIDQAKELPPIAGGALPPIPAEPVGQDYKMSVSGGLNGATFTDPTLPDGQAVLTNKEIGLLYFDGGTRKWSLKNKQELPRTEGVSNINPEGLEIPQERAVAAYVEPIKQKTDTFFEDKFVSNELTYSLATGTRYGDTGDFYGWGFSTKKVKNLFKIKISLGFKTGEICTTQRLVIKVLNKNGAVLLDKTYSHSLTGNRIESEFDFSDTPVSNINNDKLWVEIYCNTAVRIYRVNPPEIFTEAAGYPRPTYVTKNDMGATDSQGSSSGIIHDIIHTVFFVQNVGVGFTEKAKNEVVQAIIETDGVVPNPTNIIQENNIDVATSSAVYNHTKTTIERVEKFMDYEYVENVAKDISEGSTEGYGDTASVHGWGFPIKPRKKINKINIKLRSRTGATSIRLLIRKLNEKGDIIFDKLYSKNISNVGTIYSFDLGGVIENNDLDKLYVEFHSNQSTGIYRVNPATTFTEVNGYPKAAYTSVNNMGATGVNPHQYYDIYHEVGYLTIEDENFTQYAKDKILDIIKDGDIKSQENLILTNENERISFTGSSVTWGDGYLQSGYVAEYIKWKQTKVASALLASDFTDFGVLQSNRKYFLGKALRMEGIGSSIEFEVTGNEVSIVQAIDRTNTNASEIEVYIDNQLHDVFDNYNTSEIGLINKSFTGNGTSVMFDLGKAFTYNHIVFVDGGSKVVTHNTIQGSGFSIPITSDCAIIRKIGNNNGKVAVTHWLWFKNAPAEGQNIEVSFNYGASLTYEKTTVGEDSQGNLESPYGDGDISFDPTAPSSIGSGLDFRQTDERVVKTYRFLEDKTRRVKLKIKGLIPGAIGNPYFLFNFATNRYFHFQNAGIGGWHLWELEKNLSRDYLRGWQRVAQFNPNKLVIETTPNDDWRYFGYRMYKSATVNLATLRGIRNMPLRSLTYNSIADNYDITIWRGTISAIDETSVTFDGILDSTPEVGDYIMIGQYWSNNYDYITRVISAVDGNRVYFNKPIDSSEIIYESLNDFVGKEISIRNLNSFKTQLKLIVNLFRDVLDCPIYILENPMPAIYSRDLWAYPLLISHVANEEKNVQTINYTSLRKWQESIVKNSINLDVSKAVLDPYLGKRVLEFGSNGQNTLGADVLLNGISIYGKRAVVQNGRAWVVNQTDTGSALNKTITQRVRDKQVDAVRKPRLVILDDDLTTGNVTVEYASQLWSSDSCHVNTSSSKLYADFLKNI